MTKLSIREVNQGDVAMIADYWLGASETHLLSMGVDSSKLPSRASFITMLTHQISLPLEDKNSYCLIWERDGQPIGHCNTNPTQFGKEAFFHVHIWHKNYRKLGFGQILLLKSITQFFDVLKLKKLIGEPFASNPGPNRMLQVTGFTKVKKYNTIPGSLSFKQEVIRWEMKRDAFNKLSESK